MANKEILLAIQKQIMSFDDIKKEVDELKIQLANRKVPEVSDKENQTDLPKVPKFRNFATQTEKTDDTFNARPKTLPQISFFRSRNLFTKKQKKQVKYLKKGPLCRDFNASGFLPPLTLTENKSVLPNSSPQMHTVSFD